MIHLPYDKLRIIGNAHWKVESHAQRISTKEWKLLLLNNDDTIVFEGRVRRLVAKNLGYGVVEIRKEALK